MAAVDGLRETLRPAVGGRPEQPQPASPLTAAPLEALFNTLHGYRKKTVRNPLFTSEYQADWQ